MIFLNCSIIFSNANNFEEINKIESLLSNEDNFTITESNNSSEGEKLIDGYNLENARKVYFAKTLMLTAYEENPVVDSIISEKYQWCVPGENDFDDVSLFTIKDGETRLSGIRPALGYYLSDDEILKILSEYGVEANEIISIKYIFSSMYYTVFNVIETKTEILCIPYSSNEEYFGFENKKVFVFEDLMRSMTKRFNESELKRNPDAMGGVPLRKDYTPLIVVLILVSVISVIVVIKQHKKKSVNKV